ncbi:hypothetical protein Hanom_Chr17g01560651 [Helianthus anomalus]
MLKNKAYEQYQVFSEILPLPPSLHHLFCSPKATEETSATHYTDRDERRWRKQAWSPVGHLLGLRVRSVDTYTSSTPFIFSTLISSEIPQPTITVPPTISGNSILGHVTSRVWWRLYKTREERETKSVRDEKEKSDTATICRQRRSRGGGIDVWPTMFTVSGFRSFEPRVSDFGSVLIKTT